jgi:SAM-dependent methyltransferase
MQIWRRLSNQNQTVGWGSIAPLAIAVALLLPIGARADRPASYQYRAASIDGIGKFYYGREIAQVMGYAGASWLERPERAAEERPDWLVEDLPLSSTMTVADIGAGSGYLTRLLSPRVPGGRVYAVDVQPEMVGLLKAIAQRPEFGNVVPVQGAADDVQLPAGSIDLAVMVDVYHELEYPAEIMASVLKALKPDGRVVFVEYRAEDPSVPIKALHKMSEAQIRREMAGLPLAWEPGSERLPLQHLFVFRKREGPQFKAGY